MMGLFLLGVLPTAPVNQSVTQVWGPDGRTGRDERTGRTDRRTVDRSKRRLFFEARLC